MIGGNVLPFRNNPTGDGQLAGQLPIILNKITGSVRSSDSLPKTSAPRRILVVDDHTDSVASLTMLLTMVGHETSTAYDGLEAVSVAEKFHPHIVLLDLNLPKLDGYAACQRIRSQKWGKSMMLVAVTALAGNADRQKSLDAGFDMHLVKPVDAETLIIVLAAAT